MKAKVYHDGGCPICNLEINKLKNEGVNFEFVDVSNASFDPEPLHTDLATAQYWLHWVDENGVVFRGYDANLKMWHAAGQTRLAAFAGHPWVRPAGQLAYSVFAKLRHPLGRLFKRA